MLAVDWQKIFDPLSWRGQVAMAPRGENPVPPRFRWLGVMLFTGNHAGSAADTFFQINHHAHFHALILRTSTRHSFHTVVGDQIPGTK